MHFTSIISALSLLSIASARVIVARQDVIPGVALETPTLSNTTETAESSAEPSVTPEIPAVLRRQLEAIPAVLGALVPAVPSAAVPNVPESSAAASNPASSGASSAPASPAAASSGAPASSAASSGPSSAASSAASSTASSGSSPDSSSGGSSAAPSTATGFPQNTCTQAKGGNCPTYPNSSTFCNERNICAARCDPQFEYSLTSMLCERM